MALFPRRRSESQLVELIVSELSKAGNNMSQTPMASAAPYVSSTANNTSGGQGLLQTPGFEATPLPRMGTSFGSQLGPGAPFLPAPLDPVLDETGRALPRLYEYPVAWNLNLTQRATPWTVLRALTDQCDIIHRCIEIRISQLTKMGWGFALSDHALNEIMAKENVSHAKAARIGRERYEDEMNRLREFWENPYPELGRSWNEWLTEFLWQHFAFDGVPVYPRYNLGKNIIGFEIIDAPTIKVLLDNRGAVPQPPNPAYQQILWGFPRGEYQAAPESDGEFYSAPGRNDDFITDQIAYFVRNRRTWSPYGFSAVEEALPAATLYLERQKWLKSEYVDGAMPMTFMETDAEEFDVKKLAEFERLFNDMLSGQTGERHRVKVLPRGFKPAPMPTVDERYKPEYDEFIIKRIGSVFGVSPSQLGVVPRSGLGGKGEHDGENEQTETVSQRPMENFVVEVINALSRRFLGADKNVTFVLNDATSQNNEEAQARANQISTSSAQKTLNDIRGELNMPLYDMPEADEPFIVTASGPMFLRGSLLMDGAGETVEQKDSNNGTVLGGRTDSEEVVVEEEESRKTESESNGDTESPEDGGSSSSEKALVEELVAFRKFVSQRNKTGKWRDFIFKSLEDEDAIALNRDAEILVTKADGFTPPEGVRNLAKRALEWIADGKAGSGFTDVGRKRASDLARGATVSLETVKRMKAYFDRHQPDRKATGFRSGEEGFPSPGRVAWDAWGGDAGYSWSKRIVTASEKGAEADADIPLGFYDGI